MLVVLSFQGEASRREDAEAELRRSFPDARIVAKTSATVEADLSPEQARAVADLGTWAVRPITYAEISPPSLNLDRLRAKLDRR